MNKFIEDMQWRYATKLFDPERKVEEAKIAELKEILKLTPSSYGMQLYKIIDVRDPAIRQQLREAAWGQPQITDASHLFVFAYNRELTEGHLTEYGDRIYEQRKLDRETIDAYLARFRNWMGDKEPSAVQTWMRSQMYIALGTALSFCAMERIDSCPLEGLDPEAFDKILELEGYSTAFALAIGYRTEEDKYQYLPKVRKELDSFIETL